MSRAVQFLSLLVFAWTVTGSCLAGAATDGSRLLSDLLLFADGASVALSPAFSSAVLDTTGRAAFAAAVGPEVEQVTITPRFTLPGLTVSVGNVTVNSEHPSVAVSLTPGGTTSIEVHVARAIGGSATYEVLVTRIALSGLTLSADGSPVPFAFSPETLSHAVTVGADVQMVLVMPVVACSELTVTVDGSPTSPSQPSIAVDLTVAQTTSVAIGVTGPLGSSASYELVVTRAEATLLCSSITVALGEEGRYTFTATDIAAITGLPEAAVAGWQATPSVLDCGCVGDVLVSVSGETPTGAQATCQATVHAVDDQPPAVEGCPPLAETSVYPAEGDELLPDLTFLVRATDNCGVIVTQNPAPGTAWSLGETPVELCVSDPSGNEAAPCQTVLTLQDLPYWPMIGQNAERTNSSLVYGLSFPWFASVYPQTKATRESGMWLELVSDFVVVGKGGTVFVRGRERGPRQEILGDHLVAIDPESESLLWTFPILARAAFCPAVGADGSVYCFDKDGRVVALDPEIAVGNPRVTWTADLSSLLPAALAEALGPPIWEQFPGIWISYWQPILVGPEGNLYVTYRNFLFAFGPPPGRPLLWVRPGEEWASAASGPDGVFYTRSWRGGNLVVTAVDPKGTDRWTAPILATAPADPYRSPAALIVTADGNLILPITSGADGQELIALSGLDGHCLATYGLSPEVGEPILLALGPRRTLFVVTQTPLQSNQGRTLALHAFHVGEGETQLDPLWSTALGAGWPDTMVVDAAETAHVCIRRAAREDRNWSDNSELVIVHGGTVRRVLPVWGRVGLSPDVSSPGTNLALGKEGSLYRVAEYARTNDPGGRGNALIRTLTSTDPLLFSLGAKPQYGVDVPPIEFLFTLLLQDPLLRFKDFSITWDFGDGTVETVSLGGDSSIGATQKELRKFHTYAALGTFPVHVTVRLDPEGLVVAELQTTACADPPKIRQIAFWPSGADVAFLDAAALTEQTTLRAYVGQSVEFGCSASVPCAGFDRVDWHFGDGKRATGRTVQHTYSSTGTYTVEVRVGETPLQDKRTVRLEVLPLPDVLVTAEPQVYSSNGLWVHLRVELSALPPQPLSLVVDLGDGNTERRQTTERIQEFDHAYAAAGTYHVAAAVLETDIHGETTVDYRLPPLSLQMAPSRGLTPLRSHLGCESLLAGWPTTGLIYEWTIDNEIITEWTSKDGITHFGPPDAELSYSFTTVGIHSITCYAYDPNSRTGLHSVCSGTTVALALPVPDGIRVPFLKDPGIPSGAKCRWACGGDCPESCVDHADVVIWLPEPIAGGYYKITYPGVISCGTHEGCRWHDDCFDMCAQYYGESDWWEHCHMHCNEVVADRYPTVLTPDGLDVLPWISWQGGGGPYDGWFLYSDPPTWEGPFAALPGGD
jgi:hypothetical protein